MGNVVGGLVAVALGILTLVSWRWRVLEVVQGLLPILLILGGIVAVYAGWELTKEKTPSVSDEDEPVSKPKKDE